MSGRRRKNRDAEIIDCLEAVAEIFELSRFIRIAPEILPHLEGWAEYLSWFKR